MDRVQKIKDQFHPQNWNWKTYGIVGLFLLGINLFGSRGLVHWTVIHQQKKRTAQINDEISVQIKSLEKQMSDFKKYGYQQQRSIREELGYLKGDEWSLEFVEAAPAPIEAAHK